MGIQQPEFYAREVPKNHPARVNVVDKKKVAHAGYAEVSADSGLIHIKCLTHDGEPVVVADTYEAGVAEWMSLMGAV